MSIKISHINVTKVTCLKLCEAAAGVRQYLYALRSSSLDALTELRGFKHFLFLERLQ